MPTDEIPILLLHPPKPTLNQRDRSILMENTMAFQLVVWALPHEHLRQPQLHVRLRKDHRIGLFLYLADLIRAGHGPIRVGIVRRLGPLLQQNIQEFDTQGLRIAGALLHVPGQNAIRNRREEHAIAFEKVPVIQSDGVSHTRDTHCLQHAAITKLLRETFASHQFGLGGVVRLQTTDVVRICLFHHLDQAVELQLELLAHRLLLGRPVLLGRGPVLRLVLLHRVNLLDQFGRVLLEQRDGRERDFVSILLEEVGCGGVGYVARKMTDAENSLGLLHLGGAVPRII
mmetsp:Transcript_21539/g.52043  ORF Transcript_21539/g.52043 Transcript_21539/m.52043 type:complete len:286 (+) Transcript_21539:2274-3131(+)